MLHVANGDALVPRLREAGIEGEILAWRDMMSEGPLPNGLREERDWRERAAWLAKDYRLDPDAYVADASKRLLALAEAAKTDEVVLWFDEELFCQANLCHLLDWLRVEAPDAKLALVLDPEPLDRAPVGGLREMLALREPVTSARWALARAFWNAVSYHEPTGVPRLLAADLSAWPDLAVGLRAHLARFPDARTGLSGAEAELLRILAHGPTTFHALFEAWQTTPLARACGFGDAQVAAHLVRMARGAHPLVRLDGHDPRAPLAGPLRWTVAATSAGRDALEGRQDALALDPPDRWIGGVRLAPGNPVWRRDGERLVVGR